MRRILRGQAGAKKERNMLSTQGTNMSIQNIENTMMGVDGVSAIPDMSNSMQANSSGNNKFNLGYELPDLSEKQWSDWLLAIPAVLPINYKSKQTILESLLLDPAFQLK